MPPRSRASFDRPFLIITGLLVLLGVFIFSSASLGLLARDGVSIGRVLSSQFILGIGGGVVMMTLLAHIPYRSYRTFAPYIFLFAVFLTALVFVPGFGYEANGARRWLLLGTFSFQPSELLKLSFVLCLAWYYSMFYRRLDDIRFATLGLLGTLGLSGLVLLFQPDTGTFAILATAGGAIAIAAGTRLRHLVIFGTLFVGALAVLAFTQPYLLDRVTTFMNPANDPTGSGYQIRQSLIAVGSGGWFGRGFGQSVQKFHYLPEPIGDSVFSVAAEEFGFAGSVIIVGLFIAFAVRGLVLAGRSPDRFGGLIIVGIVILIITQSFLNIASMVGLVPLTGEPLAFISHGGTALLFALAGTGIVLNISRYIVTKKT